MVFRVQKAARGPDRIVAIRRPFALLGRSPGVDIAVGDRTACDRHVYLHLDPRGVYAVDLATPAGTRFGGADGSACWLRPGDWLEVAGHKLELLEVRQGGGVQYPPPCTTDLLANTSRTTLAGVALEPRQGTGRSWVLNSELVFAGRSAACGIPIRDHAVARVHVALLRTEIAAYVINLCGRDTSIDGRPVRGAAVIKDSQVLALGATRYVVSVEPGALPTATFAPPCAGQNALALASISPANPTATSPPTLLEAISPDSQRAILAWMMGTVQGSQSEALRQQGERQRAVEQLLHQIQQENSALLATHLARIEEADRELAALRTKLRQRDDDPKLAPSAALPPPPEVTPLAIPRTTPEASPPQPSTTWLLQRLGQLESQNRSAWREFLGRFTLHLRRAT
jgi:hypothetical protein